MNKQFKPMLATDFELDKVNYPVIAQPKIDGVCSLNVDGKLVGRSLKSHNNKHTTSLFSVPELEGFHGEMVVRGKDTSSDCCRATTSALSTIEGEPEIVWFVFDFFGNGSEYLPYDDRYDILCHRIANLPKQWEFLVYPISTMWVYNEQELLDYDATCLDCGYEGTIIRNPNRPYKYGRSTISKGEVLRIKRFVEEEAIVVDLKEGNSNNNEATKNELGYTERSSHKENMIPNGQVGTLICKDIKTGKIIDVAPGKLTREQRIQFWNDKDAIIGKMIKYKTFPKGVKDKPRFPTFQTFRMESDYDN